MLANRVWCGLDTSTIASENSKSRIFDGIVLVVLKSANSPGCIVRVLMITRSLRIFRNTFHFAGHLTIHFIDSSLVMSAFFQRTTRVSFIWIFTSDAAEIVVTFAETCQSGASVLVSMEQRDKQGHARPVIIVSQKTHPQDILHRQIRDTSIVIFLHLDNEISSAFEKLQH